MKIYFVTHFLELAKKLKVYAVHIGGMIPVGRGIKVSNLCLDKEEIEEVYEVIKKIKSKLKIKIFGFEDEKSCPAGREKVALLPNGDLYPCGLLISFKETKIGNIFEKKKSQNKYAGQKFFEIKPNRKCLKCSFPSLCPGGCPALVYSLLKNFSLKREKILCNLS